MNALTEQHTSFNELTFLKLAREIAMDIIPLEQILSTHGVQKDDWEVISSTNSFQNILRSEVESWQSARNTSERVRLKSLAFVEESLPEFFARAHDPREALNAKNDILKTVAGFAGIKANSYDTSAVGEKFSVTINLGADKTLKIEKDVTSKVIEHEE
jgi:hypothetical protein